MKARIARIDIENSTHQPHQAIKGRPFVRLLNAKRWSACALSKDLASELGAPGRQYRQSVLEGGECRQLSGDRGNPAMSRV